MPTTYYVSHTGNDSNAGTEANPFRTSAKLATVLGRGDTAFFHAGGTYDPLILASIAASGTIKITIGRYGTGADPVFSAFVDPGVNWLSLGGNKWTYNNASFVNATILTIANEQKPFGKFPETGFGTIQSFSGATQITDAVTLDEAPDLVGAELVVKKSPWTVDRNVISAQTATTLTTASDGRNYVTNYGWFAQNHPSCLFKNGDWCYVDSTKMVHLYSTTDPNTLDIDISFNEHALRISGTQHVNINNCKFVGAYADNILVTSSSHNVKFDSCHIQFSGTNGLRTFTSNFLTWTKGIVENTNNHGILVRDSSTDATITKSKFQDNAVILGAGGSGNGQMCGVFINNSEHRATISGNYFNRSGNCAVYFRGDNTIVDNNYATKSGFLNGDSAAFYTFGRFTASYIGIICRRNIAYDCNSNNVLTNRTQNDTCGFYTDDNCNDILLEENYAFECGYGLYIHNTKDSIYRENILINNGIQIRLSDDEAQGAATTFRIRGLNINNNTIKSLPSQRAIVARVRGAWEDDDPFLFGIINNNKFDNADASPFNVDLTFVYNTNYTLATWRTTYDFDINSTEIAYNETLLNDLVNTTSAAVVTSFTTIHKDWDDISYEDVTLQPYESILLFDTEIPTDFNISGDILLPALTSEAVLDNVIPIYEISGDIILPALTSEASLLFGTPTSLITGDILLPALTSEAVLENVIPIYEVTGDILLPALTSEASLIFGTPGSFITGDILLPALTSEAVLTFINPKNLFIAILPSAGGTATGAGAYSEGQEVLLTATPSLGYIFGYWMQGVNILSYNAAYTYTITAASEQTVVAFFDAFSTAGDIIPSPGARVPLFTGLSLSVNGEYLDLPIGFETQLNRFNPLFQTEGVIRDDYTLPIPLPHSDHNARILGNPGIIENKNRFATRTDAVLYYNGMPQLRGQLRIKSPVNKEVITVNFVSGISEISTDLAERPLRQIMEEEVVIHATDFNRAITLTYQPVISTFFGIQIMDRTFEEDTLVALIDAINAEVDFPYTASTPGTDQITISPVFNNEFLDFWINFLPGSEWRLNADPGYTASYISTYSTFINQYRGISPSNKLRFPTNANMNGFFDEANNKEYPIINYLFDENISKNHVFQPAGFGTLLGTIGNPRVRNTTSLAPYVTIEYVLDRIAAFYDITIKAPFLGSDSNKMIIDHPNTIDRPVRYIDTQRIILFERSFNIADLVPDIKVNEFLKALQGMGYALVYDQYSRTLEYFLRDPFVVQDTYIDFTDRFGDVIDIQNQPRKGVTFRHSEDNSDKISETGVTAENNGKKSLIVGDGEKIIETGFAVPIVRDNTVFFPGTAGTLNEVATKDTPSSPNFPLRLAFSFESFFFYPAMLIMGDDFTLSWFGDSGLTETTWKHWKEVENESATITIPIHLTEIEALRKPYWLDKILVDRNKYLIRSFELVIQENTDFFECEAILVRIPYSERDGE